MKLNKEITEKIAKLPNEPGIYFFYGQEKGIEKLLYVGKATSLKSRVSSYFQKKLNYERPIEFVISQIAKIKIKKTESVLEAYFLEQKTINNLQPKYNVLGKDDKSFVYVGVTKEEFPRFLIYRKTDLEQGLVKDISRMYGPFVSKHSVENALKILRKIFPYHSNVQKTEKGCLDYQIGLCPGPYAGKISSENYHKNIEAIEMIFSGKKRLLIKKLQRKMNQLAKREIFEEAAILRNQVFSLQHIQDMAMVGQRNKQKRHSNIKFRVEGYDISNTGKNQMVGSMVVFDNQNGIIEANKSEYRKFKIKRNTTQNDLAAMKEILERRFSNKWTLPNLVIIDGGSVHLRLTREVFSEMKLLIPIITVAKGPTRKRLKLFSYGNVPRITKKTIAQVRDEAHRFAIGYHRKLRAKSLLNK